MNESSGEKDFLNEKNDIVFQLSISYIQSSDPSNVALQIWKLQLERKR